VAVINHFMTTMQTDSNKMKKVKYLHVHDSHF